MRPSYVVAPTNIPFHMSKYKIFCPILEDYILNNFLFMYIVIWHENYTQINQDMYS